ncbi:MAG: hypothetical protein QXS20_01390 [Candidatus Thorarchaeota archaeon]
MTSTTGSIRETVMRQIEIEKSIIQQILQAEKEAEDTAVKLVYTDVRMDSEKHVRFLEVLLELMDKTPCDEWSAKIDRYIDRVKLERTLQSMKQKENEMSELSEKLVEMINDPLGRFLVTHLSEDEKRHESDLEELIKLVKTAPLQPKRAKKGSDIKC